MRASRVNHTANAIAASTMSTMSQTQAGPARPVAASPSATACAKRAAARSVLRPGRLSSSVAGGSPRRGSKSPGSGRTAAPGPRAGGSSTITGASSRSASTMTEGPGLSAARLCAIASWSTMIEGPAGTGACEGGTSWSAEAARAASRARAASATEPGAPTRVR